jgi:hypothetical protein
MITWAIEGVGRGAVQSLQHGALSPAFGRDARHVGFPRHDPGGGDCAGDRAHDLGRAEKPRFNPGMSLQRNRKFFFHAKAQRLREDAKCARFLLLSEKPF